MKRVVCDPAPGRSPRGRSSHIRAAIAVLVLAAAPGFGGCATEDMRSVPPLDEAARAHLGPLLITLGPVQPSSSFGPLPTSGSGWGAAGAAGYTVLGMTAAGASGGPLGLMVGGALGVVLSPFAAIAGAVMTPDVVQPETMTANTNIIAAIHGEDWAGKLQEALGAKLSSHGKSVSAGLDPATASRLALWIEGPWLALDGSDAIPTLTIHGELLIAHDCVLDRRWHWNGAGDDFDDLGEDNAKAFKIQIVSGISQLADAIVSDLFVDEADRAVAYEGADALPRAVMNLDDYQNTIASWDKTEGESAQEPRCGLALDLQGQPAAPSSDSRADTGDRYSRNL